MAYNLTEWEFSHVEANERTYPQPEEGARWLKIEDAAYSEDEAKYVIKVLDLTNEARFTLSYWPKRVNKVTGELENNDQSIGTLTTLGRALFFGSGVTVPSVNDIIGGVVVGQVKLSKPNESGRRYPRVYEFAPVPKDMADGFSDIDQYYEGKEIIEDDEEPYEEPAEE